MITIIKYVSYIKKCLHLLVIRTVGVGSGNRTYAHNYWSPPIAEWLWKSENIPFKKSYRISSRFFKRSLSKKFCWIQFVTKRETCWTADKISKRVWRWKNVSGSCNLVNHEIKLSRKNPIKQAPRRVPLHMQDENYKFLKCKLKVLLKNRHALGVHLLYLNDKRMDLSDVV